MKYLSYYFILINIVNFILFIIDKEKAKKGKWRIPESWLFFTSIIGGSLGALLAMKIVKHKNRKISFTLGIPVLIIANFLSFFYLSKFL